MRLLGPNPCPWRLLGVPLGVLVLATGCPVEPATGAHQVGGSSGASGTPGARVAAAAPPRRATAPPGPQRATPASHPAPDAGAPRARAAAEADPPRPAMEDPTNQVKPVDEARWLETQGRALLEAVAAGEAQRAARFFFPRKPFTPLKRAGNADAYWQHLWRLYVEDVARLRRRHGAWTGATFESLTLAGPPLWVPPGKEHNLLGYYRTQYARLRYRLEGRRYSIFLHTLITWQGRWYITHLGKPRPLGARRPERRTP